LKDLSSQLLQVNKDPAVESLFLPFSKGAVAIATSEELAYKNLSSRTDAQHERAKRQITIRKIAQPSCGVMTVEDALRKIASNKAEEEKKRNSEKKKEEATKRKEEREQEKLRDEEEKKQKKLRDREESELKRERARDERKREREEEKARNKVRREEERAAKRKCTK
jgi:hypothetical protein